MLAGRPLRSDSRSSAIPVVFMVREASGPVRSGEVSRAQRAGAGQQFYVAGEHVDVGFLGVAPRPKQLLPGLKHIERSSLAVEAKAP
jgi:hypothetical protein